MKEDKLDHTEIFWLYRAKETIADIEHGMEEQLNHLKDLL